MLNFRSMVSLGLVASLMTGFSACVPSFARHDAEIVTQDPPGGESQPAARASGPEMWLHGIGDPQRLTSVSAHGVRLILNVRKDLSITAMRQKIARLQSSGLGLVITIRWPDPNSRTRPVKLDTAPTEDEAKEVADTLLEVLNLPESREMNGRLWVQFYNEVTGGPGTIMPEQADAMYQFATETAERIRKEAPRVRIAGPSLTSLDPLESRPRAGSKAALRREGLRRAIDWSVKNADAVDIHLHCSGGDDANHQLDQLRAALGEAGQPDMPIVSFEWSPARFAARATDLVGAQEAIRGIYQAMSDHHVRIAAYAAFADTPLKSTYEWAYLWDAQGKPHEPFVSLYRSISEANPPTTTSAENLPEPAPTGKAEGDDGN